MIDILVISHACFRRINRLVYNYLAKTYNLEVEIVAPKKLSSGGQVLIAEVAELEDINTHFLELKGNNPRYYEYEGILPLINQLKPKIIHLDNDPVSLQSIKMGNWAKKNEAYLTCLSCENLPFDVWGSLKKEGIKSSISTMAKIAIMRRAKKKVDHVFTINDRGTAIFKNYGFKNVSKTPLGFFPDVFFPNETARIEKRKALGVTDKFVLAYIGRLVPEKGVDILLKSLTQIKNLPSWTLIIDKFEATKSAYHQLIYQLITDLDLTEKIKYFDADHFEIADYMNAADAVIMPSISTNKWVEQYGRVAPEAMACGKIVIASNTGALPELIQDAGVLIEERNIQQLATTLEHIIKHKEEYVHLKEKAINRSKSLDLSCQAATMYEVFTPFLKS